MVILCLITVEGKWRTMYTFFAISKEIFQEICINLTLKFKRKHKLPVEYKFGFDGVNINLPSFFHQSNLTLKSGVNL